MKLFLNFFIAAIFLLSCSCRSTLGETESGGDSVEDKVSINAINHFNITIASDLSNRLLRKKPVKDTEIIDLILDNVYPKILNHKRSMNQRDQIRMSLINERQIVDYNLNTAKLQLDFNRFKHQGERIGYLAGPFNKDKQAFSLEAKKAYAKAQSSNHGSDIWNFFQQGLDPSLVNVNSWKTTIGNVTLQNQYRNILILLTDGYIEANIFGKGYDLSGSKMTAFRRAFNTSGSKDLLKFYRANPKFQLKPVSNPLLRDLEVLVIEIHDRTESISGSTVQPSDYQIMKLAWAEWLKESGAKRVHILPKFQNKQKAEEQIMSFIGV